MAILKELVDAAARFEKWQQLQDETKDARVESRMALKRAAYDTTGSLVEADSLFLEEILEDDDLMPIRYFELGRLASRSVARIRVDAGPRIGEGHATGFLVAPGLLMTNWHVLPTIERAKLATATFDGEDDVQGYPLRPKVYRLRPDTLYWAHEKLDVAVVAVAGQSIDRASALSDFGFLRLVAQTGKILRDEYATVIQHPRGRQKQVAARNNKIIVYVYDAESEAPDNNFIYYQSDTQKGSSGAPVLSDQFYVVALHRRGVPATKDVDGVPRVLRHDGTRRSRRRRPTSYCPPA